MWLTLSFYQEKVLHVVLRTLQYSTCNSELHLTVCHWSRRTVFHSRQCTIVWDFMMLDSQSARAVTISIQKLLLSYSVLPHFCHFNSVIVRFLFVNVHINKEEQQYLAEKSWISSVTVNMTLVTRHLNQIFEQFCWNSVLFGLQLHLQGMLKP